MVAIHCQQSHLLYFNEHDKFAAQWLRNLFSDSIVDESDIRNVQSIAAGGLDRFTRCHFFGGIAGWEYALQLAGWPTELEVWTGSCPCQPFSSAGKRKGVEDERHLWPAWFRLIRECRPQRIFGEQVESAIGHGWLDGVSADLEAEGYAVGAAVLGAHSVGAPHIRQRLFWVAESDAGGRANIGTVRSGAAAGLRESQGKDERWTGEQTGRVGDCSAIGWMAYDGNARLAGLQVAPTRKECETAERSGRIVCIDGKSRRVPVESSIQPLAHGIPRDLGRRIPELRSVAASARANRVGRLRGYGNAIVPQVAAEFIQAFMEINGIQSSYLPVQPSA